MSHWTTVDLLRHGEADHNVGGEGAVIGGWADLPLTTRGRQQAAELAAGLTPEPPLAALYSSPSRRALDTAAAIAQRLGLPIVQDDDLREIGCGEVDGVPIRVARARHADAWAANAAQLDPDFRWPGGESYREFRQRAVGAVQRIAATHTGRRVVLLTHAGVINQLIGFCRCTSPACWERYRPRNASLTRLLWHAEQGKVLSFDVNLRAADEPRVLRAS
jgi:broad specificity phosphatase PhoE